VKEGKTPYAAVPPNAGKGEKKKTKTQRVGVETRRNLGGGKKHRVRGGGDGEGRLSRQGSSTGKRGFKHSQVSKNVGRLEGTQIQRDPVAALGKRDG